jgi:hypothetical protein
MLIFSRRSAQKGYFKNKGVISITLYHQSGMTNLIDEHESSNIPTEIHAVDVESFVLHAQLSRVVLEF